MFRYFVFIFLFITTSTNADWKTRTYAEPNKTFAADQIFSTHTEACEAFKAAIGPYTNCRVADAYTPHRVYLNRNGTPVHIADYTDQSCPLNVTTKPITVPGWTEWDIDQTDAYHNKIADTTVCYDGCRYKEPSLSGSQGSDLMSLTYGSPVKDPSCPPSTEHPPTVPPDGYVPPEESECKNENGSDSYCPKPPNGCPDGYSEQSFNGEQICVKNSPEDPNPNDPNNDDDDQPPASEPTGGDGGGDVDLTPVINAINSLKAAFTSAINSLKESLTSGFKTVTDAIGLTNSKLDATNTKLDKSNEHLDNIKKESIKTNENLTQANAKLDKSNEHLKDITDATTAASEAIGETNNKLDGVTDAVDAIGKCKNKDYDPRNVNSQKYVDCTAQEMGMTDTPFQIQEQQITQFQREDHVRFGQTCPFQKTTENLGYFTVEKDITFICDFGHEARPYIQALGYLGALIYLLIALRSKD